MVVILSKGGGGTIGDVTIQCPGLDGVTIVCPHGEQVEQNYQKLIMQILTQVNADQDVYISETPPLNPEPGDVWYKPSEDRYYHWIE